MLHTVQNTPSVRPGLHEAVTNAVVSPIVPSALNLPEHSPFYTAMTYAQFMLHTHFPEQTFQALIKRPNIEHRRQGVLSVQNTLMRRPYLFYYQNLRLCQADWLFVFDLGHPFVVQALQRWSTLTAITAQFAQKDGVFNGMIWNPVIDAAHVVDEGPSPDATMVRVDTVVRTLYDSGKIGEYVDSPSTRLMLISAGEDYIQFLRNASQNQSVRGKQMR